MSLREYTYIAGDWDHDKDAVDHLEYLKSVGKLSYRNVHDTKSANDNSLNYSIKRSLKERLDISKRFVLIVGTHTDSVTAGGCQLCSSYNSWNHYCARGYSLAYDSYIKFECKKAAEAFLHNQMTILVLYKDTIVNSNLCPESVRRLGIHIPIEKYSLYGNSYWDDSLILDAFSLT